MWKYSFVRSKIKAYLSLKVNGYISSSISIQIGVEGTHLYQAT